MPSLALIGVPSSAGGRRAGQEKGPGALRAAGLLERLRGRNLDVADFGDLLSVVFRPDPENPRQQNLPSVVRVARQVADAVDRAISDGRVPLVLGGDCSLTVGVIAGVLRHHSNPGLVYFDGDVDLNTPETTVSGIFDGMVMAHVLGRGAPELAGLGPRRPLLEEEKVVFFGYDESSGWIDPPELEAMRRSRTVKYPLARVREDAVGSARKALDELERRSDAILVHFDVDVMDFAAVDVPHPGGLNVVAACSALRVFTGAPTCAAVVVSEFNAELDPEGTKAEELVEALVGVFED
jgi:arginase